MTCKHFSFFFLFLPFAFTLWAHEEVLKISIENMQDSESHALENFVQEYKSIFIKEPLLEQGKFSQDTLVLDLKGTLLDVENGEYLTSKKASIPKEEIKKVIFKAMKLRMRILLLASEFHMPKRLQVFFKSEYSIQPDIFSQKFHMIIGAKDKGKNLLTYLKAMGKAGKVFMVDDEKCHIENVLKSFCLDSYRGILYTNLISEKLFEKRKVWGQLFQLLETKKQDFFSLCCGKRR